MRIYLTQPSTYPTLLKHSLTTATPLLQKKVITINLKMYFKSGRVVVQIYELFFHITFFEFKFFKQTQKMGK